MQAPSVCSMLVRVAYSVCYNGDVASQHSTAGKGIFQCVSAGMAESNSIGANHKSVQSRRPHERSRQPGEWSTCTGLLP